MKRRLASIPLLFLALAACSDKPQPQSGSQTHFLETCNASCPEPYECICGACTLTCSNDGPCSDQADVAHCTVAVSTDESKVCNTNALVCDAACQRESDCHPLGAGYTCDGSRCRAAPRDSTSTSTGMSSIGETPAPLICDGSDDIRLGIWNTAGSFTSTGWMFLNPLADSFAFIDGKCRFYASADALTGVASGRLDEAEAEQLAIDIHLASFDEFQAYNYGGCADGGSRIIADGAHSFACTCGSFCGDSAPEGLSEAMDAGQMWINQLAAEGTLWNGAVSAVATGLLGTLHLEAPQTWPLPRAIDDIVVSGTEVTVDSGMIFDAGDASALRRLRSQQASVVPRGWDIYVTDGSNKYSLFVRDELPQQTTAPFTAFETSSWKIIEDAANAAAEKELAARDAGSP